MDTNQPIDVAGEVAKVARIALDAVVLAEQPGFKASFVHEFIHAAGNDMARPERIEDVEHFAIQAAQRMLADPELLDTLICLIKSGVRAYMEPA